MDARATAQTISKRFRVWLTCCATLTPFILAIGSSGAGSGCRAAAYDNVFDAEEPLGLLLGVDLVGRRSFNVRSQPASIQEGQSHTTFVSLVDAPAEDLQVTITSNSTNVRVAGATTTTLTFTPANYASEQSLVLSAGKGALLVDTTTTISLAATNAVTHSFGVAIAQFTNIFQQSVIKTTGQEPVAGTIADFDGDGKPDIVVVNWTAGTISVFLNQTSGGVLAFADKQDWSGPASSNPSEVLAADFDGDGKRDLVISNYTSGNLSIFCNTSSGVGNLNFSTRLDVALPVPRNPGGIAVADFDGDTKPDIAVANTRFDNKLVHVFRNTSSGNCSANINNFSFARTDHATTGIPYQVAAADLDGDGKPDLIASDSTTKVSVFRNTGSSGTVSFAAVQEFAAALITDQQNDIGAVDMDGDGLADLIHPLHYGYYNILRNTSTVGSISVTAAQQFTVDSNRRFATGDIDGDGKPDILSAYAYSFAGSYVVRNKSTSGNFQFLGKLNILGLGTDVMLGDLDADGKPEAVIVRGPLGETGSFITATEDAIYIYKNMFP